MTKQIESNSEIKSKLLLSISHILCCCSTDSNLLGIIDPAVRDDVRCFALGTVCGAESVCEERSNRIRCEMTR